MLDKIIAYKKNYVSENFSSLRLKDFLLKGRLNFICEYKPSSPSLGVLNKKSSVEDMVKVYEPFSSALSVLACEKFFGGSKENVLRAKKISNIPILFKDIIVSPLQICEARLYGADAVLLMMSVLDDNAFKECLMVSKSLNLDVICEVHDEEEIKRALSFNVPIIGINNRNFKDMSVDINTTKRLRPLIPKDIIVISESGFFTHDDILSIAPLVDGFLVGSSLMMDERPDLKLRELIFGKVKICGLKKPKDAKMAYDLGAYYGGLNFSPTSKRFIKKDEAKEITKAAPLIYGGIFVDDPIEKVLDIALSLNLSFVQLHGRENDDYRTSLREKLPKDCKIWQAFPIKDEIPKISFNNIDMIVLDRKTQNSFGGSGESFSWSLLSDFQSKEKVILAGGINENNAKEAMSKGVSAIDIATGSEDAMGHKSYDKMKAIFLELRS